MLISLACNSLLLKTVFDYECFYVIPDFVDKREPIPRRLPPNTCTAPLHQLIIFFLFV